MTPASLVETRVLDGPNRHLDHPAIQVRLDVARFVGLPVDEVVRAATQLGMDAPDPGEPGTEQRQLFARRFVAAAGRRLAADGGTAGLTMRVRPGYAPDEVLLAFPWRRLRRGELLGTWVAWTLDDVGVYDDLVPTLEKGALRIADEPPGDRPGVVAPQVPTVTITGTNGKTSTTRLVAHLAMAAGRRVAFNNTDGIFVDGVLEEAGDWAGFGGAQRVLASPGIETAVVEVARGGILRRGMGVHRQDVAVVTNVAEDHLGELGVDTLDDLAEVKSVVVRSVRPDGHVVLNADDARVLAMRHLRADVRVWGFSPDADSSGLAELLRAGGRGVTLVDGHVAVVRGRGVRDLLLPVADVPVTVRGLSPHMVANALAATAAGLALGLPVEAVVAGLRTFGLDGENPGRLNVFARDGVTVVADIAHNPESLTALLTVGRGLVAAGGTLRAVVGSIGDRADAIIVDIGRVAGELADQVVLARKDTYLRGRETDELIDLLRRGMTAVGAVEHAVLDDELDALDALLARAVPGDTVCFATHVHYRTAGQHLADRGFVPASVDVLTATASRPVDG